jgi:hypothetical protein
MSRWVNGARSSLAARVVLAGVGVLAVSGLAWSAVKREGAWPDLDKKVSVEVHGVSRAEAIRKLADAAGWSVVLRAPPGDPVDLHVKDQPAGKVLELLLGDARYVASREGTLVSIAREGAEPPAPPAPSALAVLPLPPAPPAAPSAPAAPSLDAAPEAPEPTAGPSLSAVVETGGEDRVVTGGSLKIEKGDTVHDVVVMGGSVDVWGKVTGDLAVLGGSARVHDGAHVRGDATAVGGALTIEDGARVDGDVGVVGGSLRRGDHAQVGGVSRHGKHGRSVRLGVRSPDDDLDGGAAARRGISLAGLARDAGGALTRSALLFVFGAVFLALATRRMESLQAEVAARPMRSFALGIVGALAAFVALVALCVTVVGIPFAFVALLLGAIAAYVGICAVLTTAGGALLGHRTKNPYVHLAAGCALLLVLGAIPYVGGLLTAAVVLVGIGALVATRAAGLVPPRKNGAQGPYRTAAAT